MPTAIRLQRSRCSILSAKLGATRRPCQKDETTNASLSFAAGLYSVGGFSRFLGPPAAVWVCDEHIDRWNAVASLPQPRGAHATAVADGRI